MEYEWDSWKAAENLRKHGLDLLAAIPALEDPNRLEALDTRLDYAEERLQVVGMATEGLLFVVTTMRAQNRCRIISVRRATRHETDRYYSARGETW